MKYIIIHFSIIFSYYIIAAYATTDILRLLKGSTLPVLSSNCYCPICHQKIKLIDQIPIFSYFRNHGRCRNCKSKISSSELFLEFFLFLTFSLITIFTHFHLISLFICIGLYEITKIIFILLYKPREQTFFFNLVCSLLSNFLLFSLLALCYFLVQL